MHKMQDGEVRRMAVFKLRRVARELAELEACAEGGATRACLAAVRAALYAASQDLQASPSCVIVEGDDEARFEVG